MSRRRGAIRTLGAIRRRIFESPEKAAWRLACRKANVTPRFTPGHIRLMDLEIHYADLLTLCPQWEDIFVKRSLAFASVSSSPRILDCGANVGLASLFNAFGDLSGHPLDGPVPEPVNAKVRSIAYNLWNLAQRENLSIRQFYQKKSAGSGGLLLKGTAEDVADG